MNAFRGMGIGALLMRVTSAGFMARGPAPMRFGAMIGNDCADRFHTRWEGR